MIIYPTTLALFTVAVMPVISNQHHDYHIKCAKMRN